MSRDEELHRIRVKTKQWRARIKLFKDTRDVFSREEKALKALSADLCAYRDYQVLLKILMKHSQHCEKGPLQAEWSELLRLLKKERGTVLRPPRLLQAKRTIQGIVHRIQKKLSHKKIQEKICKPTFYAKALRSSWRKIKSQASMCQKSHENIDFHTLRKRCKDMEYQLEWIYPNPSRDIRVVIRKLHQVNADLGKANDWAGVKALSELYGMRRVVFAAKKIIENKRARALRTLSANYLENKM